jgi:hypothetical protein
MLAGMSEVYNAEDILPIARKLHGKTIEECLSELTEGENLFVIYVANYTNAHKAIKINNERMFIIAQGTVVALPNRPAPESWEGFYAIPQATLSGFASESMLTVEAMVTLMRPYVRY